MLLNLYDLLSFDLKFFLTFFGRVGWIHAYRIHGYSSKQCHLGIRDIAEAGHCAVYCRAAWTLSPVRRGSHQNTDHSLCRPQSKTLVLRRNLSHIKCLVLSINCNKQSVTLFIMCFHVFFTLIFVLSFYWSWIKEEPWEYHYVPWNSQA